MIQLVYCGSIGVVAEYLVMAKNFNLKAIICEKDKVNSDLLTVSYLRGIELRAVSTYKEFISVIAEYPIDDTVLMCSFGIIVKNDILSTRKVYNIHTSKLPDYRGRHPTFHATINGEKYFGISLHEVNNGIDTGNIIAIEEVPYYYWMAEGDLMQAMLDKVPNLIENLSAFLENRIRSYSNENGRYFSPVTDEDKIITPIDKPSLILNKIRAQSKYDGALVRLNNKVYGIKKAQVDIFIDNLFVDKDLYVFEGEQLIGIRIHQEYFIRFLEMAEI
jgi:methionyl-tRNA formyltransferase